MFVYKRLSLVMKKKGALNQATSPLSLSIFTQLKNNNPKKKKQEITTIELRILPVIALIYPKINVPTTVPVLSHTS